MEFAELRGEAWWRISQIRAFLMEHHLPHRWLAPIHYRVLMGHSLSRAIHGKEKEEASKLIGEKKAGRG